MKILLLMRHAKSSWKYPDLPDRERPLNKRGEKDAPKMAKLLKHEDLIPEKIMTSTAVRAAKTAEAIAEKVDYEQEIDYLDALYLAEPSTVIDILHEVPDDIKCVLVVGHNPGMEGLVQILSRKVVSLSTATIAYFKLPIKSWKELSTSTEGNLKELWEPKD